MQALVQCFACAGFWRALIDIVGDRIFVACPGCASWQQGRLLAPAEEQRVRVAPPDAKPV